MTADKNFKRLVRDRARRTGESYATARLRFLQRHGGTKMNQQLVPVKLSRIATQKTKAGEDVPFVDLAEVNGDRHLYVLIGVPEATAIARVLQNKPLERPQTHDVLGQAVTALDGRVDRVVISRGTGDIHEGRYFTAEVVVVKGDGAGVALLDSRPSDAIALGVRCDPFPDLFVDAETMRRDGMVPQGDE